MYAELAIYTAPGQRTFHYLVPEGMVIAVGQLVEVSFRTARSQGIILDLADSSPVPLPKPILEVLVAEPVVTPLQIKLAQWMAEQTFSSLSACLWLTLPPGLVKRGDTLYTLIDPNAASDTSNLDVIALLRERGSLRAAQIDRALPKNRWRETLRPLLAAGIVRRDAVLAAPDAKVHYVRTARLAIPLAGLDAAIDSLKRSPKQAEVLKLLAAQTQPLSFAQIAEQTGAGLDILKRLAEKGLVMLDEAEQWRDPLADRNFATTAFPPLTPGQAACWTSIREHLQALTATQDDPESGEPSRGFLLHGVTGSGKTEIYLRAIDQVLEQGRQAIVLVPEISLVPQTVQRFASRFPGRVAVVHSDLTEGEQYDTWRRARAGDFDVVVGARSALFTPLSDVGLIVIDEEHDDSYKQSPPIPPYYHARETALAMMRLTRGTVILGSATPDVITSFRARRGELTYLKLPDRVVVHADQPDQIIAAPLPPITVIDMRQELHAGNRSMFSRALREALIMTLARGEQAILFLNRRGTATFILCRDCGYVAKCPRCDMPLTYHQDAAQPTAPLRCHYCGYSGPQPVICPQCGGQRIRYFGAGTASIEEAVKNEFEGAIVLRWDRDTTQVRGTHEKLLERFAQGEANVMVGTQMIVKGLDLPRVTLVGVILADTSLGLPDYRAGERTFQLLTQAAGRAGRSSRGGRVIFQTYQPDHYAIRAASGHDYEALYTKEIVYRRDLQYPPFKRLVRFQFRHANPIRVQHDAEQIAALLRNRIAQRQMTATELIGPAPAFFGRIDDVYRWHIIARTTDPALLLEAFSPKPGCYVDVDPVEIL